MNNQQTTMQSSTKRTSTFIQSMPKAEIHIHLEGAIEPETVLELAGRHQMLDQLPSGDVAGLQRWFTFTDFPHFVEIYFLISNLLRTPEDFALIVHRCGADMAAQNIRYRELTFTPYTHTDLLDKGLTIDDLLAGLDVGRQQAKDEFGVEMRWVFDVPRNASFPEDGEQRYDPRPAERTLEYALQGQAHGVVGFGLGGYEVGAPPEPFAHVIPAAKEAGLRSVPHAGETMGADSVWGAVTELVADRIGHGVRAMEDPALLNLLKERQIPLEINPTSNVCLHVYRRLAEHPFPHLDRMGLFVTVNSDDPPLFNTTLCQEYEVLATEFGYNEHDLGRIARNAFVASGAETELKRALLTEFDAWVEQHLSVEENRRSS
ncbi:adenosine deaminase [Chloroflexi bacterium TSY]|nr:adenosine deaminase [Chloroflexi bacterium TSY]